MPIRTIVVATDLSPTSEPAVDHAAALAKSLDAKLVIVHTTHLPSAEPDLPPQLKGFATDRERILAERATEARAQVEALTDRIRGQGVTVSNVVADGYPDEVIPRMADELGADLLVIGSHGATGVRRFVLGSTAERVVRIAACPVLVVRGEAAAPAGRYRNILAPIDFSAPSNAALDMARELVADDGNIELFYAWQVPGAFYGEGMTEPNWEQMVNLRAGLAEDSKRRLHEMVSKLSGDIGGRVTYSERETSPKLGIEERLARGDIDLVVMGSHGHRGLKRWVLGSVAEATVRHAPCPVLVTKRGQAPIL